MLASEYSLDTRGLRPLAKTWLLVRSLERQGVYLKV